MVNKPSPKKDIAKPTRHDRNRSTQGRDRNVQSNRGSSGRRDRNTEDDRSRNRNQRDRDQSTVRRAERRSDRRGGDHDRSASRRNRRDRDDRDRREHRSASRRDRRDRSRSRDRSESDGDSYDSRDDSRSGSRSVERSAERSPARSEGSGGTIDVYPDSQEEAANEEEGEEEEEREDEPDEVARAALNAKEQRERDAVDGWDPQMRRHIDYLIEHGTEYDETTRQALVTKNIDIARRTNVLGSGNFPVDYSAGNIAATDHTAPAPPVALGHIRVSDLFAGMADHNFNESAADRKVVFNTSAFQDIANSLASSARGALTQMESRPDYGLANLSKEQLATYKPVGDIVMGQLGYVIFQHGAMKDIKAGQGAEKIIPGKFLVGASVSIDSFKIAVLPFDVSKSQLKVSFATPVVGDNVSHGFWFVTGSWLWSNFLSREQGIMFRAANIGVYVGTEIGALQKYIRTCGAVNLDAASAAEQPAAVIVAQQQAAVTPSLVTLVDQTRVPATAANANVTVSESHVAQVHGDSSRRSAVQMSLGSEQARLVELTGQMMQIQQVMIPHYMTTHDPASLAVLAENGRKLADLQVVVNEKNALIKRLQDEYATL